MNALDFGKVFMKWALVPVRNFEWIKKAYAYTRLYFVVLHIEKNKYGEGQSSTWGFEA